MSVKIERVVPGAEFRFKTAVRRVLSLGEPVGRGFDVNWEYADGVKRGGQLGGTMWVHYFAKDAIEEIDKTPKWTRVNWNAIADVGMPAKGLWFVDGGSEGEMRQFLVRGAYCMEVAFMYKDGSGFALSEFFTEEPLAWVMIEGM